MQTVPTLPLKACASKALELPALPTCAERAFFFLLFEIILAFNRFHVFCPA